MRQRHAVVIGAGIGGLAAAVDLAVSGLKVTLLERAPAPGGKMRQVLVDGVQIDAGPTVFTMRWVFESLFADAGATLGDQLGLTQARILARHAWNAEARLDLHADIQASADAIGQFAGPAEASGFLDFAARARRIYQTLEAPFLRAPKPNPLSLVRSAGAASMLRIAPFDTMARAIAAHFTDPRLRQLFGRYATYCGSSPYLAPATLMLVAHVEQDGVWLVQGGMHALAHALATLATSHGAAIRYGAQVDTIAVEAGRAAAVVLSGGERIAADAIVANADPAAVQAMCAQAGPLAPPRVRHSLSALTWAMHTRTTGFPLTRHNVFFQPDYAAEFDDLFTRRRLPRTPTIYVCAQDRGDDAAPPEGPERLLCLVNAPADGDTNAPGEAEIEQCAHTSFEHLARCGLHVDRTQAASVMTGPAQFNQLFPLTGGALYGQAVHGAMATFQRPGSRTRLPGLYLAGGATHPGAGVPMAALSGRLAAASLIQDGRSTSR